MVHPFNSRMQRTVALCCLVVGSASAADPPEFAVLLSKHCVTCHNSVDPKAGLDLTMRAKALQGGDGGDGGEVILPGKPDDSLLLSRIVDGSMPPERDGRALTAAEADVFRRWIAAGATWPEKLQLSPFDYTTERRAGRDWWSLQPLRRPVLNTPELLSSEPPPHSPADVLIREKLAEHTLAVSPLADRRTLLRRATLDLVGLPPSAEEIHEFTKDLRPDAFEKQVDRLLASPHYGERWGRHWLDVTRYGESDGFEHDKYREHAWPYRDYVIGAFNADKPLGDFIREQIAGDVLPQPTRESMAATGFLVAGPWDEVQNVGGSPSEKRRAQEEQHEELIGAVAQTFLGMTINCARCHHHKFDPIPLDDYYRLRALLSGVDHGTRPWQTAAEEAAFNSKRAPLQSELTRIRERQAALAPKLPGDAQLAAGGERTLVEGRFGKTFKPDSLAVAVPGQPAWRNRPLTVECWTKLDRQSEFNILVASDPKAAADHWELYTYVGNGLLSLYLPGFTPADIRTEVDICDGRWRHVGAAISETKVTLYVDGRQVQEAAIERKRTGGTPGVLAFGSIPGTGLGCAGLVDEVRIRRGLHPLTTVPTEPLSADENTLGLWSFDAIFGEQFPSAVKTAPHEDSVEIRKELERLAAEQKQIEQELAKTTPPLAYLGVRKQPAETFIYVRGDVSKPGPVMPPGLPSFVRFEQASAAVPEAKPVVKLSTDAERRLALAQWLAEPANPLPPRVMANRIWQYHFGRGLVETPSDFGFQGGLPANGPLLEYLSWELVRSGGSLKRLHRLIMSSHAYRQASSPPPELRKSGLQRDADNRLTWRYTPRRLEAETIRDCLLSVSGELNLQMGGPSFKPFTVTVFNTHFYHLFDRDEPQYNRRTVYRACVTTGKNPLLAALDCPAPSLATPKRQETVTPLQALGLMNDSFVQRQAGKLAAAIEAELPPSREDHAKKSAHVAYLRALGRVPTPAELKTASALVRDHGLRELCWALMNSSEFLYLP